MKATGKLAKTDRIDAQILARFAGAVGPKPSIIPNEEARPFQAILTLRRQLSGMLVTAKNRLIMARAGSQAHPRPRACRSHSTLSYRSAADYEEATMEGAAVA
jgi:transposase